jgi:MazG family protein
LDSPVSHPFQELVEVLARLRGPGGCPWDRQQTHESLARYLEEEAHEALEAIEQKDPERLKEELGDLLLQIVFHSQLAQEEGLFTAADVCRGIVDKMIRRHPHVFGQGQALRSADEVLSQWEVLKQEEKAASRGRPASLLEGIPRKLSPLLAAERVLTRAASVGFVWPDPGQARGKVEEELAEALAAGTPEEREEEVGDLLLAVAALAVHLEVNPERALRRALDKFAQRFRRMEQLLGRPLSSAGPEELKATWEKAR